MRVLLFLVVLMVPASALASSDLIVAFCNTQSDPRACIRSFIDEQYAAHQAAQERWNQQEAAIRLEQARLQANGMAMFGAGLGMIQGINQGFQNMQQPYVNTPYFTHGR